MLTVESFGPGGVDSQVVPATRVLVRDGNGNPVCLAVTWSDGPGGEKTIVAHADDDDFNDLLATFGVGRVTVAKRITVPGS